MLFFNIPDIFNLGDTARQKYDSHYEQKIARDSRNSVLLEPLEVSLSNLQDIRIRIGTRIGKEVVSGVDMSNPIALLSSADRSLQYAEQAVYAATSTIVGADPHPGYVETENAYIILNQTKNILGTVIDSIQTAVDQASSTSASSTSKKKHVKK